MKEVKRHRKSGKQKPISNICLTSTINAQLDSEFTTNNVKKNLQLMLVDHNHLNLKVKESGGSTHYMDILSICDNGSKLLRIASALRSIAG